MRCCLLFLMLLMGFSSGAGVLQLVSGNASAYAIRFSRDVRAEQEAAQWLQEAIHKATGVSMSLLPGNGQGNVLRVFLDDKGRQKDGWCITTEGTSITVAGYNDQDLQTAVRVFAATFLQARKWDNGPAEFPRIRSVSIPVPYRLESIPAFRYREAYYPFGRDADYRSWTGLQQFETLWGLWGHSYDKLVPAKTYFAAHPEYYALVNGRRQASQLCLSNEEVYRIVVASLKQRMADNPVAEYWSISPNDDLGYCTCDRCSATDRQEGGPQGSLIRFLNKVAAAFPGKKFTTLAYTYTSRPTQTLRPAANVYIMLSTIDAYRGKPLQEEPSAAEFLRDLKGWSRMTPHIFIWDYNTQFTNYLAPFPNLHVMAANLRFFKKQGVEGVFVQGSGDTYGELAELRSWVTSRLLWDPFLSDDSLIRVFAEGYYGKAAPHVLSYLGALGKNFRAGGRPLDIYGNPVLEWNSYLGPEQINQYSAAQDKAEAAVEGNALLSARIARLRLPLEYTVLQQAKMYGRDRYGLYEQDASGSLRVKKELLPRVQRFVAACKAAGVTELSEGGQSPDQYQQEYTALLQKPVLQNLAWKAPVKLLEPFAPEYPARGPATLTDGASGFGDFSYNWLCFYGVPMEAVIDMGSLKPVRSVSLHFLDDPRHWIFPPSRIEVFLSKNGHDYVRAGEKKLGAPEEHYHVNIVEADLPAAGECRYLKVVAHGLEQLPDWRDRAGKKPMLACDEVWVH